MTVRFVLLAAIGFALLGMAPTTSDPGHNFDFLLGHWSVQYQKLAHPLSGDHTWVRFSGSSRVRTLWDGVGEVEDDYFDLPNGRREQVTLRLYDAMKKSWALYLGTSTEVFPGPQIGHFDTNGVGSFWGNDSVAGKKVLVLQRWSRLNGHPHFEQSLSTDNGKTWETNWISDYTPTK